MKTYRDLIEQLEQLQEGVYDKGALKAFFIAGGPGSGKSFVTKRTTGGMNLKVINSDDAFERGLRRAYLSLDLNSLNNDEFDKAMEIRKRGKELTKMKQELAVMGRLGLILDGTGKDFDKIKYQSDKLRELGYDTFMIFVNTSLDVALQRNAERDRKLPEELVKESWQAVQNNMGKFQNYFGTENFILVDNNNAGEDILLKVYKRIKKLVEKPVQNRIGKQWIERELEARKRK